MQFRYTALLKLSAIVCILLLGQNEENSEIIGHTMTFTVFFIVRHRYGNNVSDINNENKTLMISYVCPPFATSLFNRYHQCVNHFCWNVSLQEMRIPESWWCKVARENNVCSWFLACSHHLLIAVSSHLHAPHPERLFTTAS